MLILISGTSGLSSSKKFVTPTPVSVSPFQLPDQSHELRNHLSLYHAAAYQHHSSPFRFPFLPVNRYLQSLPASPLRLPYPFPYPYPPSPSFPPLPPDSKETPAPATVGHNLKRKHSPAEQSKTKDTHQEPKPSHNNNNNTAPYFKAGSLIQLANGGMKKVEDLNADDFVTSAASCADISIDQARIIKLEHSPDSGMSSISFSVGGESVSVCVSSSHPFFVTKQGWSSPAPPLTLSQYNLQCSQLRVGDVCISLKHQPQESQDTKQKQVRFQDSPVPVKKRRYSNPSPEDPKLLSSMKESLMLASNSTTNPIISLSSRL